MDIDVTRMIEAVNEGNAGATDELFQVVYAELRRLAGACFAGERADHTLEPTALVHEAYLKLVGRAELSFRSRAQFFALAGKVMRLILVDHARGRNAQKRGGDRERVPTLSGLGISDAVQAVDVLALDEALKSLEKLDERKAKLVELRFFGGLSEVQAAEVLGISRGTASADWRLARAWLLRALGPNA